jgi:hypothetical protein
MYIVYIKKRRNLILNARRNLNKTKAAETVRTRVHPSATASKASMLCYWLFGFAGLLFFASLSAMLDWIMQGYPILIRALSIKFNFCFTYLFFLSYTFPTINDNNLLLLARSRFFRNAHEIRCVRVRLCIEGSVQYI